MITQERIRGKTNVNCPRTNVPNLFVSSSVLIIKCPT